MPVGELIAAAVGLILIIIVAYVLVGSTVGTAELMANDQKMMTQLQEIRLHTDITVKATGPSSSTPETVNFIVTNSGRIAINDFENMEVIVGDRSGDAPVLYLPEYDNWSLGGTSPDGSFHPGSFNPQDTLSGNITFTEDVTSQFCPSTPGTWSWIEVVTVNGVTSLAPINC